MTTHRRSSVSTLERDVSPPSSSRKRKRSPVGTSGVVSRDSVAPASQDPRCRIYSWNINGIQPFLQNSITRYLQPRSNSSSPSLARETDGENQKSASLRAFLRRHNWPEVLCLQEVKIRSDDIQTQNQIRVAVNQRQSSQSNEPQYKVFLTLPRDKFNVKAFNGKLYGVCSIIRSDFYDKMVSRVREVDWDTEGRFSVIETEDPASGQKLVIWNVYAVNGTDSPYRDPTSGKDIGTRHDRKLLVHKLLMDECRQMEAEGWLVLIIGDLNVAPARIDGYPNLRTFPQQHVINRADFNTRFLDPENSSGFRGVDVWRHLKGDEKKYTYYPRTRDWGSSCDRVDLAIASQELIKRDYVVSMDIWESPQERGPSDHVPLSVSLRIMSQS